jgi:S-adenosylmethionine:tRNA-ribosyltransferase-isomerase (queuine synthetase)
MSLVKRALELPKGNATRKRIELFLNRNDSYENVYMYTGRSKKIKKGRITIIEDRGSKVKIEDINGNQAEVAKSTLQTTMDI